MIKIKHDIQSKDKKTGVLGFWGAKSPNSLVPDMNQLKRIMSEEKNVGLHECLVGDTFKPFADYDKKYKDADEYTENVLSDLNYAMDAMQELFPGGQVHMFVSNGFDKKNDVWKGSAHFTVTDYGYYPTAKDVWSVVKTCEWKEIGFDEQVYGLNHSLRLPYCKKPGDDRVLRRAVFGDNGNLRFYEVDFTKLEDGLVTVGSGDKLVGNPIEQVAKKVRAPDAEDHESDDEEEESDWKKWNFDMAKDVINRLNDDRAATHGQRTAGICSILHLAKLLRKVTKFRELAHLFAKKDSSYSEDQTDQDYDYFNKKAAAGKPRTFASLIKFANEDSPVEKEDELDEDCAVVPTYYKDLRKLLSTKPSLRQVQQHMLGCLRFCASRGEETWYQNEENGWYPIAKNSKNFPFGSMSSNMKYNKTTQMEILVDLKQTPIFEKHCLTGGSQFYPYFGDADHPKDIINTFVEWPWTVGQAIETDAVKLFLGHIRMLFPVLGEYIISAFAKKLQFPRWRLEKLIIGYGRIGGEGKTTLEKVASRLFGNAHVLPCSRTGKILGEGGSKFNPQAESALVVFIQEAKADGASITCSDEFKGWVNGEWQNIRDLYSKPRKARNYSLPFLWTNNVNAIKVDPAWLRRLAAEMVSDEKIWDADYFVRVNALATNDTAIQEIYNWLIHLDVSQFDANVIPVSKYMEQLKESSLTPLQQWVVELCNGERDSLFEIKNGGNVTAPTKELYRDYKAFCGDMGFLALGVTGHRAQMMVLDIEQKQITMDDNSRPQCFVIDAKTVEIVLQKMQRDRTFTLLRPKLG